MGRHRTSRARTKLINDIHKKLSNKRNRDLKLKNAREKRIDWKTNSMKRNQAKLDSFGQIEPNIKRVNSSKSVRKEINASFLTRVERVQNSYQQLISVFDKSSALIEILDARDPQSFRFLDIEGECINNKKPILFVLSKADLVPAAPVSQWVQALSATAPTIALDLTKEESIPLILSFISSLPDGVSLGIIGAPSVGKTTLCQLLSNQNRIKIIDSEGWKWSNCNDSLAYTGSVEWKGRIRELCVEFFTRMQGDEIFAILGIGKENSPGNTFNAYARKYGLSKTEVPEVIVKKIQNHEILWYAFPPDVEELSAPSEYLVKICSKEPLEKWIKLGPGDTVTTDKRALEFEPPPPSDSEENEDNGEEEQDEEDNEEEEEE